MTYPDNVALYISNDQNTFNIEIVNAVQQTNKN